MVIVVMALSIWTLSRLYKENKRLWKDYRDKMETNRKIMEGAANDILKNSDLIGSEWDVKKKEIGVITAQVQELFKSLSQVSNAFKSARDETIRNLNKENK
jgi:uncharacterized protein YoxC